MFCHFVNADLAAVGDTGTNETEYEVEEVGTSCDIASEKEVCSSGINMEQGLGAFATVIENSDQNKASTQCTECKNWEVKYKDLKMLYVKLTIHSSEKDLKYEDLLKTKTRTIYSDIDDVATSNGDIFSPNEIKSLQGIPQDKKKDSTFILKCLEYAYKSDQSVLQKKTLKGKSEVIHFSETGNVEHIVAGKDPLTPEKVARIKELFIERLSNCEIDAFAYGERIKDSNLNKLIASGVKNISKK